MSRIREPTRQSYPNLNDEGMNYADCVAPYVFDLIATEILLSQKVIFNDDRVDSSKGTLCVNQQFCQYSFWKILQLPHRLILAFRDAKNIDKNLVAEQWTLNYTVTSHQQGCEYSSGPITIHVHQK